MGEEKRYNQAEREELRRRIGKRGALGAPVGFSGDEVAGLLAQIDELEKRLEARKEGKP